MLNVPFSMSVGYSVKLGKTKLEFAKRNLNSVQNVRYKVIPLLLT